MNAPTPNSTSARGWRTVLRASQKRSTGSKSDSAKSDASNPGANVANYDHGANWNGESGNVTTAGGCASVSPWGAMDLAGNINEMTETPGTPIPPNPPGQPDPLPTRRLRGGDFANQGALMGSPAFLAGSLNMLAEGANVGFRVARPDSNPSPSCPRAPLIAYPQRACLLLPDASATRDLHPIGEKREWRSRDTEDHGIDFVGQSADR